MRTGDSLVSMDVPLLYVARSLRSQLVFPVWGDDKHTPAALWLLVPLSAQKVDKPRWELGAMLTPTLYAVIEDQLRGLVGSQYDHLADRWAAICEYADNRDWRMSRVTAAEKAAYREPAPPCSLREIEGAERAAEVAGWIKAAGAA